MSPAASLFQNSVLLATVLAWVSAQLLKVLILAWRKCRFDFRWFLGTGGMPSAHSAGVSGLAVAVGIERGFHTAIFAVALMFALVTMFDAQGVRRAAGKQAMALNRIFNELYVKGQVSQEPLRELIGHTPVEVIAGAVLGCAVAVFSCVRIL